MKALFKTLFGDARNVGAVAAVVAAAAAAVESGHGAWSVTAMPLAAMAAVAWLVRG
jgi:hypothetical protein